MNKNVTSSKPTNDQSKALSILENYLTNETHTQLLLFIHGGPGVGKTWTIKKKVEKFAQKNPLHSLHWSCC